LRPRSGVQPKTGARPALATRVESTIAPRATAYARRETPTGTGWTTSARTSTSVARAPRPPARTRLRPSSAGNGRHRAAGTEIGLQAAQGGDRLVPHSGIDLMRAELGPLEELGQAAGVTGTEVEFLECPRQVFERSLRRPPAEAMQLEHSLHAAVGGDDGTPEIRFRLEVLEALVEGLRKLGLEAARG